MPRVLSAALPFLVACGGARISASASISDELTDPTALAACAKGDARANLAIVSDLRDSYHEMIVCGGLQLDFQNSLVNVIGNYVLNRGTGSQLQYQGNGVFASPNGMMLIKTSLLDGRPIAANPLDPQSYLVGLQVTANASGVIDAGLRGGGAWGMLKAASASLDVQFSAQGPLFDLLGDAALHPGRALLDPKKLAKAIASHVLISNRISVDNNQGGTTIHYLLDGPPQPLSGGVDGKQVPMILNSIIAERPETHQTIRVTEWTMAFKGDGGKVLDGTIGLEVDGGDFPYAVKFTYPHRMEPDIDLTCR